MRSKRRLKKRKTNHSKRPSKQQVEHQIERLEDRKLLSADLGWASSFDHGNWSVESTTSQYLQIHSSEQASHEFFWEPVTSDEIDHDDHSDHDHSDHDHSDHDHSNHDHSISNLLDNAIGTSDGSSSPSLIPIDENPVRNSNPGAPISLYLDYDGHYEPVWGAFNNITTPVYDIDGDATTFNDTELARMQTAWEAVSEDFAPFNVNVTTVEPAILADGNTANDNGVALRVAIGGSWEDWRGQPSGGIGYINSFTSSIPNVVYVFSDTTSSLFGETASHEAGHGFGLYHQSTYDTSGNLVEEYNPGTSQWQPIMGGGTSSLAITSTWYDGPNSEGAFSYQDDMAVLNSEIGYRSDDHSNGTGGATQLSGNFGSGIIETHNDVDVFRFTVSGTEDTFRIRVDGVEVEQNLDAVLELRNAAGGLIAAVDPAESLDAEIVASLSAGDYFVAVRKSSSYGFVGQYTVNIDTPAAGITVATDSEVLSTSEAGQLASFDVSLDTKPTANVSIGVSSSNPLEGTPSVSSLTFTPVNWNTPQTVVITPVDDQDIELPQAFAIILGPVVSPDLEYDGFSIPEIAALNTDDDAPGWAFSLDNDYIARTLDLAIDDAGNIHVSGRLSGSADFDLGPGTFMLSSLDPSDSDGFIAKYTPAGELLWAKRFGGTGGSEYAYAIDLDAAGNVILSGNSYASTPSFGSFSFNNQGGADAFVAKLDSGGNFLWVRNWGGTANENVYGVAVADNGTIHVTGRFYETVDFDPGNGTHNLTATGSDGFLLNLDGNGNFISALALSGSSYVFFNNVDTDSNNDVYLTGRYSGTTQFGSNQGQPVFLTTGDRANTFLMKVSLEGSATNTQWVRSTGGDDYSFDPLIFVDNADGVYYATRYRGILEIDSGNQGTLSLTSAGSYDSLISKWDSDGNLDWHSEIKGTSSNRIYDLQVDDANNVSLIAGFSGVVDVNVGAQTTQLTSLVNQDTLVLQLGSDGSVQYITQVVQEITSGFRSIGVEGNGNLIITGEHVGTVALPNGDIFSTPEGSFSAYLMKLTRAPGITVSPTQALTTSENGGVASFDVRLDTQPTANVTIGLNSSDPSEGSVSTASLTFTPTNWNVAQTVVVTGVDDASIDGDIAYSIITGSATSSDAGYNGLNPSDVTVINVDDDQPLVLFEDSFEISEWNGLWVEDNQNDWRRQTQRATDGNWSAEVDGRATNATLTTANSIDLNNLQSATLTFDWLIESGYDTNEFLSLDISTNGGATWQIDVRRLSGNVDSENTWHTETVDLSGYQTNELKFRFRSTVSRSNEDANVDNVRVVGIPAGPANEAPFAANDGTYIVDEDFLLTVTAATGVLSNDSDTDGDPLTAVLVAGPSNGSLTLNSNGSFRYTPDADFHGNDSFTYVANDGAANSNTATVNITVGPINDAPAAGDDGFVTDQDTSLNVAASGVLANDDDIDADPLIATLISGPADGTLNLNPDGSFDYMPNAGFYGSDSFTYVANDGMENSNIAKVNLTINRINNLPVAVDNTYVVTEDTTLNIAAAGILANDTDDDNDPLVAVLVAGPGNGSLGLNSDGSFSYSPEANFNGSDSFTYLANDGIGDSNIATVSFIINSVNDDPVATADGFNVDEDGSLFVAANGVLANDSDADGDSLTATLVTDVSHGSLVLNSDGSFDYTPAANFHGSDGFSYVAHDGLSDSNIVTVSITVNSINDAPVAANDSYATDEDTALNVAADGMLSNDVDSDNDSLTALLVAGPSNGTLGLNSDGSFSYTPDANFHGTDSFTYVANDGTTDSNLATVNLTVNSVNDSPVATGDSYSVDQDTGLLIAAPGVLVNDVDADNDLLTASVVSGPTSGSLTLNSDGSFDYIPNGGFSGSDSFAYVANDGTDVSNIATVSITVNAVSSGPNLAFGVASGVGSSGWTTINLASSYTSMVVVATANYDDNSGPGVVRIRNASGSSFEVMVQSAGGASLSSLDVHYTVMEEGIWGGDQDTYKLEAVKFTSTVTDENNSWNGQSRSYLHPDGYSAPVVVGQVMSYNDSDWSNFWTRGSSRTSAPSASSLYVGKMVGEDSDVTRADETIGYFVIETSNSGGVIEGLPFRAAVGADSVKGVDDAPAYQYNYTPFSNGIPKAAVVSMAGMDGGNGGWAFLYGNDSLPTAGGGGELYLAIDEDQSKDSERRHTTEQVAYFIIDTPVENRLAFAPIDLPATVDEAFGDQSIRKWLGFTIASPTQPVDQLKTGQRNVQSIEDWRQSFLKTQMPVIGEAVEQSADEVFEKLDAMWFEGSKLANEKFDSSTLDFGNLDAAGWDDLFESELVWLF